MTKEQIATADSIFVSYGFYKLKVEKKAFKQNIILLNPNIALEEVVVKAREVNYVGPEKPNWTPFQVSGNFFALISIPVNEIKDAEITGIRYNFKSWSLFMSGKSNNKRFKVLLYGFNNLEKIELHNLLKEDIEVQIPAKIPDWVRVSLREYEINHREYKYVAVGFLPLDNGIIIKQSDEKHYPEYHDLQVINSGKKINRVRVFEPTENRINVQLITGK